MNRSEFIKSLGLGASGLILPKNLLARSNIKIYDNYVRGLQHYNYQKIKQKIKEGEDLRLIREQENLHDAFAVQVFYKELKLGYLPAYENIVIANMLDANANLSAKVSYHKEEGNPYKMETLGIEIYAEIITPTPQLITELQNKRADEVVDIYRKGFKI